MIIVSSIDELKNIRDKIEVSIISIIHFIVTQYYKVQNDQSVKKSLKPFYHQQKQ